MEVYHGSYTKIDRIDLSKCRPNRDFGRGFYVTKYLHHAEKWAKVVGKKHQTDGIVTSFTYVESAFVQSICKIKHFEEYNEEWLDFVVLNRDVNNPQPAHDYDIVEGPVADDKVQNRIDDFLSGKITKSDFLEELKYHETTHQICFCTLNSLQTINLQIGVGKNRYEVDFSESIIENLMLDNKIDEEKATAILFSSNTFAQLSDETTGFYKKSWEEVYELLKEEMEE